MYCVYILENEKGKRYTGQTEDIEDRLKTHNATSHLDLESEEKIRDSLYKFFENVTAIVIAHRLTTIREMDKISVIENGSIVESGNFNELIAKQGRFQEL